MARLKSTKASQALEAGPKDVIVCKKCGAHSDMVGNRFRLFMFPHFQGACGQGIKVIGDLFEWKPLKPACAVVAR